MNFPTSIAFRPELLDALRGCNQQAFAVGLIAGLLAGNIVEAFAASEPNPEGRR